ncbi:bifunctional phosphopantothenoylcysteine decarboxylase/phosphopantothenate--cysteine ligase CoaBC [Bacilliculturomica massiliensis]|uniref:bifunctional phosphopantothenoylcysteine decarboxylase/phosphopantothenate--cysteine ligase CoaBC n=1 Tax=Bacilliculturomica massiliensis TaxID=1917867 RepID=UPI001030C5E7|nr:bifunctional phosphopantothenoylcysteine decarboxylase/phosphopantothenate--cysteine ligase CoaBC [Bacilliculturomica massiliensis]
MLKGKTVVLGVTGSIAAYKIAGLASSLVKLECDVHVIMTENAVNFINPITFETLTGNKCMVDTFDRNFQFHVAHVSLAKKADVMLIAPASANVIAKLAWGLADDMLTTTALACTCRKIVAPAMNTNMFRNAVVQDNMERLRRYGFQVIDPASGYLACGDTGEGKMPSEDVLLSYIVKEIACEKDMCGRKVLVTAGATREPLDPVRFLSNHSTGKMGYELARAAMLRGAEVTLVSGWSTLQAPPFVKKVEALSAAEMFAAVQAEAGEQDIVIKAAAVADYTPAVCSGDKIKKTEDDMSIPLVRTRDILSWLGEHKKPGQFLCGFSMETRDMLENSRAKLEKKKADMIAANNLKVSGAGFGTDTNVVTLITKNWERELPLMSKEQTAHAILDAILAETGKGRPWRSGA